MNIGETIKRLRKQKGMTQEQLAEYLDLSPQAVSRWEINSTLPDIKHIPMLANIFNVSSDMLLGIGAAAKLPDDVDIDLLNEIYRAAMCAVASGSSALLKRKVVIDKPETEIIRRDNLAYTINVPAVGIEINYIGGIQGTAIFVFSQRDVINLVDIWMGGTGTGYDESLEFNDMHESAIGELVALMMKRQAVTALQEFLKIPIGILDKGIDSRRIFRIPDVDNYINIGIGGINVDDAFTVTKLKLIVDGSIDSEMSVISSVTFSKRMISAAKEAVTPRESAESVTEDKSADDWISENMVLNDDDKRRCVGIAQDLVEIAIDVRKNGLLSIDDKIPKIADMFFQKALYLAVNGTPPDEIKKIMQRDFMEKELKGGNLLRCVLITEGAIEICKGASPMQIAVHLASFFGENYFKL
jgi:chemotaxis protein CheY-P-specific phosphatase CheC